MRLRRGEPANSVQKDFCTVGLGANPNDWPHSVHATAAKVLWSSRKYSVIVMAVLAPIL